MRIRQRAQQDSVEDGKNGSVGADPQSQSEYRYQCEYRAFAKNAKGVSDVVQQRLHGDFSRRAGGAHTSTQMCNSNSNAGGTTYQVLEVKGGSSSQVWA